MPRFDAGLTEEECEIPHGVILHDGRVNLQLMSTPLVRWSCLAAPLPPLRVLLFVTAAALGAQPAPLPAAASAKSAPPPNIIVIIADDVGIDSFSKFSSKLGFTTPNVDRMAEQGLAFNDAHSGSAVCSPTRYGLLTGRYAWRSRLKSSVVRAFERALIEPDRLTLPAMLREEGYTTAAIGKWHLGMDWPKRGGGYTEKGEDVDFTGSIGGGPTARGFDFALINDIPNWAPFAWIDNNRTRGVADQHLTWPNEYRAGPGLGVKGWDLDSVLPEITRRSVQYIGDQAKTGRPFFLYLALTAPHAPIAPSAAFLGKSRLTRYVDFVLETDDAVGQVLAAVARSGQADNTLVIFTADNGTSPVAELEMHRAKGVELQANWRGAKADVYEGGHRVPFIAYWPGVITPGTTTAQTITLTDIMATCADLTGYKLPANAAEDSVSFLPILRDPALTAPVHETIINHSIGGQFVVRQGRWKLIYCAGSGGWSAPTEKQAIEQKLPPWQLYDLATDPKETTNVIAYHPDLVVAFTELLKQYVREGRSTPGARQPNDGHATWWPQIPWAAGPADVRAVPASKPGAGAKDGG